MDATVNILNWFEIPATDIARAMKFYGAVFSIKLEETEMMGMKMAFFPFEMNGKVSGALVQGPYHKPSTDGVNIYLNANPDLANALGKIEAAGGQIIMPKTIISGDVGYMASFIDTEGNRISLHSNS